MEILQLACSAAYYKGDSHKRAIIDTAKRVEPKGKEASEFENPDIAGKIDSEIERLLLAKWNFYFKLFDHNKDKIINEEDSVIEANVFSQLYSLEGPETDNAKEQLKGFYDCLTYDELEEGISMEKLVADVLQSYGRDKDQTIQHMHGCIKIIVDLLDHNKDGLITMDELSVFYKYVNIPNKNLVKGMYKMVCPDTQADCPVENLLNTWSDFLIGDNEESFNALRHLYEEVGMPLEEFVE